MPRLCSGVEGSLFSPLPDSPRSREQLKPERFLPDIRQLSVQMPHQMPVLPPAPPAPLAFKPLNRTHCKTHSTSIKA